MKGEGEIPHIVQGFRTRKVKLALEISSAAYLGTRINGLGTILNLTYVKGCPQSYLQTNYRKLGIGKQTQ